MKPLDLSIHESTGKVVSWDDLCKSDGFTLLGITKGFSQGVGKPSENLVELGNKTVNPTITQHKRKFLPIEDVPAILYYVAKLVPTI